MIFQTRNFKIQIQINRGFEFLAAYHDLAWMPRRINVRNASQVSICSAHTTLLYAVRNSNDLSFRAYLETCERPYIGSDLLRKHQLPASSAKMLGAKMLMLLLVLSVISLINARIVTPSKRSDHVLKFI